MSATRANALPIEPASELRRSWTHNEFECNCCGARTCIVYPVGTNPITEVNCGACGESDWSDFDGKARDWRVIH